MQMPAFDGDLPRYDDLVERSDAPAGSSWGVWGADDRLGCLNNLLSRESVLRAAAAVRKGDVFPLNLPLDEPSPPLAGRAAFRHEVQWIPGDLGHDEELSGLNTQSSSQWDGFRHVRHPEHGFYNGLGDEEHGVGWWAQRGIVGRGVLADVARWRARRGIPLDMGATDPIEADELQTVLDDSGATVLPGDVLLIRTGWIEWYRELDASARAQLAERYRSPGLRASADMSRLLWDLHIAAVVSDNPALEAWPPGVLASSEQRAAMRIDPTAVVDVSLHFSLLPLLGLPIGELWDLEALALDCAADGVPYAMLTSAPLNLPRGVASPANAIAIK
jgi:hypothetical protein